MSDAGLSDGGEDVPYSQQSDGTGSIGGHLIGDLEDEVSETSFSHVDEPERIDATFEESLDAPHTPVQLAAAAASHQRQVSSEPRLRGHRRMYTSPDVGTGRPTSASETRTSLDSMRRSSPSFRSGRRSEVSSRTGDDQSAITGVSHARCSVRVVARVRPFLFNEASDREIVFVNGEKVVLINPASKGDPVAIVAMAARATAENMQADHFARAFMFDDCFWASSRASPEEGNVTQEDVFNRVGEQLVEDAVSGKNVACFAYGATETGKSHTLFGDLESCTVDADGGVEFAPGTGLILRVFSAIIQLLRDEVLPEQVVVPKGPDAADDNGDVAPPPAPFQLSAMQIHLEAIRDLFVLDTDPTTLKVMAGKDEPFVTGLDWEPVYNAGELVDLLRIADGNRKVIETEFDIPVARAHTVVTLKYTMGDGRKVHVYMVDLAASEKETVQAKEKLDKSKSPNRLSSAAVQIINQRREESKWINRSLSNLGTLLAKGGQGISIRDSKLTWFLKPALGGKPSQTSCTLIATLSPAERHYAATLDTLKYAARVAHRPTHIPVASADAPDPEAAAFLQQHYDELRNTLRSSKDAAREWQQQLVADPQQRIAKMERSLAREGPPPKEPVTPIIFQSRPYVDTMEQEVQCDLIGDPRLEISNLQNELASKEQQLSSALADKEALEMDYKALERQLDQERDKHQQVGGLSEEEHYRELRDLQARLEEVEDLNSRLENAVKELSREKRQKEEELALTKQKNESLEKHMQAAMDGRLRDNLSELADAKAENEALRQQIEDLREENRALKEHANEQTQELYDVKMKALDKDYANEAREREIAALRKQLREKEEQLRELDDKLQTADARNAVLARQLQQARDELARLDDLQSEIARLRKQNDSARAEHERELARMAAERDDALQNARHWQQAFETERAEKMEAIRRLEQRQGALSRLESEGEGWARLQAALQSLLEREGAAMSSEVEDVRRLSDMLADARRKTEELAAIRRDLQREQQDHEQTRVQLAKLRSQLPRAHAQDAGDFASAEELVQLQRKSRQQQIMLERYRAELAKAKEEAEDWAARAREFQKLARDRAEIIRSTVAEKRREASPAVNVEELQHKLAALQSAKDSLLQENERLRGEVSHARDAARRLKEHFQQYKESKDRELTAIWLAVHKLDMMDALKTATLEAVKKDRDQAMRESKHLNMELRQVSAECFDLHRELHGVDANLLAVADAEGVRVDDLRPRASSSAARLASSSRSRYPSSTGGSPRHASRGRSSARASHYDHDLPGDYSPDHADAYSHRSEMSSRRRRSVHATRS